MVEDGQVPEKPMATGGFVDGEYVQVDSRDSRINPETLKKFMDIQKRLSLSYVVDGFIDDNNQIIVTGISAIPLED